MKRSPLLFLIFIEVCSIFLQDTRACDQSITLTDEKVQRITISNFSQVIDVVQKIIDQGVQPHQIICAQDWDCYLTDDYFEDRLLRSPEIPNQIERLKALALTFILTGRWIDASPERVQVEQVMKSLERPFSQSSLTLSPYDVFQHYHGLTRQNIAQFYNPPENPSQLDVCQIYAQGMQHQSHLNISQQKLFQNLEIDLRTKEHSYGYFVNGFCFTNGQINSQYKADTLMRLLDHPCFPVKDIQYVIYGDDDLKYINFVEESFKANRKERLITLYFPNPKSQ